MNITIKSSKVSGSVNAPSSKSMTHRYLVTSALANGNSILHDPLRSDDTTATINALKKLGITIKDDNRNWLIEGGTLSPPNSILDCKESGTTLRFMTGICSLIDKPCVLSGSFSLIKRPNAPLLDALNQLGVRTDSKEGYPPITVKGRMQGGHATIRGDISSQFISSIILAAPYAKTSVELKIIGLESKPYVHMTLDAMKKSGVTAETTDSLSHINVPVSRYNPIDKVVEGDWSSAAFLITAGVLSGKIEVRNLDMNSHQADKEILRILETMQANIKVKMNSVITEKSSLSAINTDMSDCPDLFPIVSCLCSTAKGKSMLSGLSRLKIKESDRLVSMTEGLKKMGVKVSIKNNSVVIEGGNLKGALIDPYNDHRVAMSFAILGLKANGMTTISNPDCVSKSYPNFWEELEKIGARFDK
jgi:3-phosphoshikimate 1-carboxyvinyltransferase